MSPALRYACRYWIDHARHAREHRLDGGPLHRFLKTHALDWLMAMSIMGKIAETILIVTELKTILTGQNELSIHITELAQDLWRFLLTFRHVITTAPYQVYIAALVFSPQKSIMRDHFSADVPQWVKVRPSMPDSWSQCRSTFEGHFDEITTAAFSPDSLMIASGSDDMTIRLWNLATGEHSLLEGHASVIRAVEFSPDGRILASASDDLTIRLWSLAETIGGCRMLEGHTDGLTMVVFSPNGELLVSGSIDGSVRLWNVSTGECCNVLDIKDDVHIVMFTPDSQAVIISAFEKIIFWNPFTNEHHSLDDSHKQGTTIALSPDGRTLAFGCADDTMRVVQAGMCVGVLRGHSDEITSMTFSTDGQTVASGSRDDTVRLWDLQGRCLSVLEGHFDSISMDVFSPDGSMLASGSRDYTVRLWDTRSGECLSVLRGHTERVRVLSFSPIGQALVSGSDDSTLRLWDVQADSQYRRSLEVHTDRVHTMALSSDGQRAASGFYDQTIRLWTLSGECIGVLGDDSSMATSVTFSPDGQILVSGSDDGTIRLWSRLSQCLGVLRGHTLGIEIVTFSPDGQTLASGSNDKAVRLWNLSGKCLGVLLGHIDTVLDVVFSPDGQKLASGSQDDTIRLWSLSGECLGVFQSYASQFARLAFSPDGQTLASGSYDSIVRLWDVNTGTVVVEYNVASLEPDMKFSKNGDLLFIDGVLFQSTNDDSGQLKGLTIDDYISARATISLDWQSEWVILCEKHILWLPPEYRSSSYAIRGDTLMIGSGSGEVFFLQFDLRDPELNAYITKGQ